MLYISEIYYRFFYFLIALIFSILVLYINKNDIIFITIIPITFENNLIDYFIFTEPREILFFYIYSCFNFLLFSLIPYILFIIFDFIKSAVYAKEWIKMEKIKYKLLYIYIIINFITFFIGLPIFWEFFSSFQQNSNLFTFFLELSAIKYFYYFNSIFILTNLLQILFFISLIFFFNRRFSTILINKKYLYLIFLIFSTLITPPDLLLQIFIFCNLYICLEILIFLYFYKIFISTKLV